MNRHAAIAAATLLALALPGNAQEPTLKIGSKAPAIAAAKWVKGEQVASYKPGHVYVVEFWATWCGPCKESIPHLTELAKKYSGKVTFVGVSIWETEEGNSDTAYIAKVESWVKEMGAKMDYTVAIDGPDYKVASSWMLAARQDGIPTAFVVDGNGEVAWIGHPMVDLDETLDAVIAGKFDAKAAAAKAEQAAKEAEERNKLLEPLGEAMANNDHPKVLAETDKLLKSHPEMAEFLAPIRFQSLLRVDEPKAYAYAEELYDGIFKELPMELNNIAWAIVYEAYEELKAPDLDLALKIAERATKLSEDKSPYILDTVAYVHFMRKDYKKAVEFQERAVKLAEADGEVDEMTRTEMKERLAEFKKKAG